MNNATTIYLPIERMRLLTSRARITVNYKLTNTGPTSSKPHVPVVTITYGNGGTSVPRRHRLY